MNSESQYVNKLRTRHRNKLDACPPPFLTRLTAEPKVASRNHVWMRPFFSFFACTRRSGPLKLTCHSLHRGEESQNWYWLHPAARATSALRYSFDVRSFNINCGFSADGNVFFIAVTLWWSGRPVVCDSLWCVVDELLFYPLHVWITFFFYSSVWRLMFGVATRLVRNFDIFTAFGKGIQFKKQK